MLRLPKFKVTRPKTLDSALALLAEHQERALIVAGGTDLVPNMKHELFTPDVLVALAGIEELRGIRDEGGTVVVGAMTPLDEVATSELVRERAPVLAQAVSLVAGPQLRRMGTLGGNVMLDTRCQWYNQTYFWREALGFCLKKDGTACHVVAGGKKCVAAASNDSAPALMALGATAVFHAPGVDPRADNSVREVPVEDLFLSDGIYNKKVAGEILSEIRIPRQSPGHRSAYGKLRDRGSIDFPLLGVACRLDVDKSGLVEDAEVCVVALQARPVRVRKIAETLRGNHVGTPEFQEAVEHAAQAAAKQCRPLDNVPGDAAYRHRMVPVYVRRTLRAAAEKSGPVHHI